MPKKKKIAIYPSPPAEQINPLDGLVLREEFPISREERQDGEGEMKIGSPLGPSPTSRPSREIPSPSTGLHLVYENAAHGLWLYHDNCLAVLDAIAAKYPEGRFDCIFADPPYFLSNGGITCHAGKMVKVHKGDWDKSRGWEWNHEFNRAWLERCQRVLKPHGTLWVTGTHHVIFSVGFALQQLGFKILNDIAWEKPNPPPNLSCRYFTHSTETLLWAAKNDKSKHIFNYAAMRAVTGKQMKTVWRKGEFPISREIPSPGSIWTMTAPGRDEKQHGKHPTQKPVALIERCLLAATNPGDLVLDPFMGAGTTAVACIRLAREFVGIEMARDHFQLAQNRADHEIVLWWLRTFKVQIRISVTGRARRSARTDEATENSEGAHGSDAPYLEASGGASVPASRSDTLAPIGGEGWGEGDSVSDTQPSTNHPQLFFQNDLDLFGRSMDRIKWMEETPPKTECIYHETKFVFLSCAVVSSASVVRTTVDVSLQEAWAKTPTGKQRETTHVVRCVTEIIRIKD